MLRLALAALLLLLFATPALTAPAAWLDGLRALSPRTSAMDLFSLIWTTAATDDWDGDVAFTFPMPNEPGWEAPPFPEESFARVTNHLTSIDGQLPTINDVLVMECGTENQTFAFLTMLGALTLTALGLRAHTFGAALRTAFASIRSSPRSTHVAGVHFFTGVSFPRYMDLPGVGRQVISAGLPRASSFMSLAKLARLGPAIELPTPRPSRSSSS